ncbi:MAG TPA: AAA family ATPase [Planctomycetota bacterium]|nr:AAA family ATPase [Planctomycetota bacterium]
MISSIHIQNFKSIESLLLKPGRVTVLIGENGSGKSNILEAIAFGAASSAGKLESDFYLFNRGIRVTDYGWIKSGFRCANSGPTDSTIKLIFGSEEKQVYFCNLEISNPLTSNDSPRFEIHDTFRLKESMVAAANRIEAQYPNIKTDIRDENYLRALELEVNKRKEDVLKLGIMDFLIFAPENTVLRNPPPESAVKPLGSKGEGIFNLLQSFGKKEIAELNDRLQLFGWFDSFLAPSSADVAAARIQIRDRWLPQIFDQRSANEGFLFVLFYLTLLISKRTPKFFSIDNIDTSLNPKLCSELMKQIVELAKKYDKQVICTTHNPCILDGLNLKDDEQRLLAVKRDSEGRTVVHRVHAPKPQPGESPVRMSVAFIEGYIGGLPVNF